MDYHYHSSNPIVTHSNIETAEILKRIDLYEFLGVTNRHFSCLFHEDRNPSAHVICARSGKYFYKCFSAQCTNRSLSIIDVVMRVADVDVEAAVQFLCSVYHIHQALYDYVDAERESLQNNIMVLDALVHDSPLYRFHHELLALNFEALRTCNTTTIGESNRHVFFMSNKHYAGLYGGAEQSAFRRLCLFTYLGLLQKAHPQETSEQMQSRRPVHRNRRWTGLFYIPRYTEQLLHDAEERYINWQRAGGTMQGISYEFMLLVRGEEVARSLFPQSHQHEISRRTREFYGHYHDLARQLLAHNGYVQEAQILSALGPYTNKKVLSKRVISFLALELGLERVMADRAIKERYSIRSRGHPIIYLPQDRDHCTEKGAGNCAFPFI